MKQVLRNILLSSAILAALFIGASSVHAQALTQYKLLEPIPLDDNSTLSFETNAGTYIQGLFRLALALASVLAVIMIIYGGVLYMSTDAYSGKSDGKKIIQEAFWGLALTMGAWIIVATIIGPEALKLELTLPAPPTASSTSSTSSAGTGTGGKPGYVMTPEQIIEDNNIRTQLKPVTVNNSACTTGGTQGCTNVVGLPQKAIDNVRKLAADCATANSSCSITISGGTEGGHSDHGIGLPVYDLRPSTELNNYLAKTNSAAANPQNGTRVVLNGASYTYEIKGANGRANADHWHVEVK